MEKQPPFSLTADEMADFGLWLSIDLADRTGQRGRRQMNAMVGFFCGRPVVIVNGRKQRDQYRGSDFSFRVALLVLGWSRTGMTIQEAAEKTASEYSEFLKSHLGKSRRGRRSKIGGSGTHFEDTVRTIFYKVQKANPEIDVLLEHWFWYFLHCCDWIRGVDPRAINLIALDYQDKGRPEMATMFRDFVAEVRHGRLSGRLHRQIV